MFKRHSLQVKIVKDDPNTPTPTTMDNIMHMTPEEVEEASRRLMRQIAIHVGAVVVTKVAVHIALKAIVKKYGA
jgi:hypothetical protein